MFTRKDRAKWPQPVERDKMSEYISVTETAKLIRVALKKKFPETKFSVKSSKYAGGASIDVSYMDGPLAKAVEAIAKPFAGGGFDGMIDMAYSKSSFMLADGTVTFGNTSGTTGSMGLVPEVADPVPTGAKEVHFGADYVFVHRAHSVQAVQTALKEVAEKYGYPEWAELEVKEGCDSAWVPEGQKVYMKGAEGEYHWCVQSIVYRHMAGER